MQNFFKSEGSNKKVTIQGIFLSFKALWKSQDLGTKRPLHSQNSLSVQCFNNIIIKV